MGRGQFWAKFRTTECLWCFNAQVPVAYNDAGGGKGGEDQVSGNDAGTLFSWSRIANIVNGSESF